MGIIIILLIFDHIHWNMTGYYGQLVPASGRQPHPPYAIPPSNHPHGAP